MMTWTVICAALLLLCHVSSGCIPEDELFVTTPTDVTVNEGEDAMFRCKFNPRLNSTEYQWDYTINGMTVTWNKMNNPFNIAEQRPDDVVLIVPNVVLALDGAIFDCVILGQAIREEQLLFNQICSMPTGQVKRSARIFVKAPPAISNLSPSAPAVNTQQNITITARVTGSPTPQVSLYSVPSTGVLEKISTETHPRVSMEYPDSNEELSIVFSLVRRADNGVYRIVADNSLMPVAMENFTLDVSGVDPPEVSVDPFTVASYDKSVHLFCTVQPDGYDSSTVIQWIDTGNNVVSSQDTDQNLHVVIFNNGTVRLTIGSLSSSLVGMYQCMARNGQFSNTSTTMVYGPPPSPRPGNTKITFDNSRTGLIVWTRPEQSNIITQYKVQIYNAGGSDPVRTVMSQMYLMDHTSGSVSVSDLSPGNYEFTITAISNNIEGEMGPRQSFTVEETPFPLTIVIGAAAGGFVLIVILLLVAILVFYCCCKYYVRRKGNSSHQQWNSDEEKMPGHPHVAPVMNNYTTALALDSQCDLPPSPMSPMTSAMGIDPKWEFPRENITLQDELAVGQFTVLYKATARGLRGDNRACDVTVKALREGATEDDLKVLIYEMDMLATIDEHPNIVSLLRVCSVGKPVFMVMEYMCHGDLLGFLRCCRNYRGMYSVSPGPRYQPPALQLCSRDLINMATKIANAMRFLADRKIVHRALCARNILVGTGMDVKVYNIGSFDIPVESGDSLAKWMAPETLFDGTNTTYSDVWSFGVTMWELITIGGTPYPDIPTEELYPQLQGGTRMACPPHCAQEVYDIVSACWEKNPLDRPHFAIIHENLDELLMSKLSYLDLRSYNGQAYSQFDQSLTKSTPL